MCFLIVCTVFKLNVLVVWFIMIIDVLRVRVNVHGPRKLTVYRQRTGTPSAYKIIQNRVKFVRHPQIFGFQAADLKSYT